MYFLLSLLALTYACFKQTNEATHKVGTLKIGTFLTTHLPLYAFYRGNK